MDSISLCMITKNEEDFLPKCLESVRTLVDEIVIVDTGSTDGTVEIAKSYGAKAYHHPWEEDFSKHRNQSISHAEGNWILIMDADEVLAERDLDKIKMFLKTVHADSYYFTLRNYENTANLANLTMNPQDYEEGTGFPGFIGCDLIRLFRKDPLIYFTGQVHETVTPSIVQSKKTIFNTRIPIHHYGKVRGDRLKCKQDSYLALGMKRLEKNLNDPMAYKGLTDQLLESGLPRDALTIANRGLALFPAMLELHFNRGLALDRLGEEDVAGKEYQWVLARQQAHLGACHNLAQIFSRRNQWQESIQLLEQGIAKGIRHPAVFFLLGRAFAALGKEGQALDNFKKVLEMQANYPEVNCHMAVIFLKNHQYDKALQALEKEIAVNGNLVAAYSLLGEMSLYWQDRESAKNFFQKVLTITPHDPRAQEGLKRCGYGHCSPLH